MLIILGIALSEIASIIEEKVLHDKQTPVFYVKDLKKMYQNRLKTLGASEIMIQNVNVTRMKEDLLEQVPGLREQRDGKYVILTVDDEFGRALIQCSQNTMKEDGIIISKAAKIVRRCMFKEDEIFDGNLSSRKQKSSVSVTLLRLVSLIMNGENSEENVSTAVESLTLNMAQLLRFNSVKGKRRCSGSVRHSRINEPPLPVKIGLMIHAKTRKKGLVEALASEGLCISYKRVEEIQNSIVTQLCAKYIKEDFVCPPALQKGLFTTAAIDNIDHDPSSTGAKSSFHGTSISIFQHRESNDLYENTNWPFKLDVTCSTDNSKPTLPCHFTDIRAVKGGKPEYPSKPSLSETNSTYVDINENASE